MQSWIKGCIAAKPNGANLKKEWVDELTSIVNWIKATNSYINTTQIKVQFILKKHRIKN